MFDTVCIKHGNYDEKTVLLLIAPSTDTDVRLAAPHIGSDVRNHHYYSPLSLVPHMGVGNNPINSNTAIDIKGGFSPCPFARL